MIRVPLKIIHSTENNLLLVFTSTSSKHPRRLPKSSVLAHTTIPTLYIVNTDNGMQKIETLMVEALIEIGTVHDKNMKTWAARMKRVEETQSPGSNKMKKEWRQQVGLIKKYFQYRNIF